jgi:hypothetical protein
MVIQLRLALVSAAVLCAMGMFATTLLARASASAGCSPVQYDNTGPALLGCHRGLFTGYPSLLSKGCKAVGVSGKNQLWACPSKQH